MAEAWNKRLEMAGYSEKLKEFEMPGSQDWSQNKMSVGFTVYLYSLQ